MSEFMVIPNGNAEFVVTYWPQNKSNYIVESIEYYTHGRQDEGTIFTMALSDELIMNLLGENMPK